MQLSRLKRAISLLLCVCVLPIPFIGKATAAFDFDIDSGSDSGITATYDTYSGQAVEGVSFYAKEIDPENEVITQAKASLEGAYEQQTLAWEFKVTQNGEVLTGWGDIYGVTPTLPLSVDTEEYKPGTYTEGMFAGTFDGYAGNWDTRYIEAYAIDNDANVSKISSVAITGAASGNPVVQPTIYTTVNQFPAEGIIMLVQKELPKLEQTLAPGTYHVPLDLWRANQNTLSMSNEAINHDATVYVDQQGNAQIEIDFDSIEIDSIKGHLLKMYYASESQKEAYIKDSYNNPLPEVKVLEYKSEPGASQYIGRVKFPLSSSGQENNYIYVQVDAMGSTLQFAKLKLHWNYAIRVEGDFAGMADGEYDVEIRGLNKETYRSKFTNDQYTDSLWGVGESPSTSVSGKEGAAYVGKTARAVIKDGQVTALYLTPEIYNGNAIAIKKWTDDESDATSYNILYSPKGNLFSNVPNSDATKEAIIVASEKKQIKEHRHIEVPTIIKLESPKTTTGLMTLQFNRSAISIGTVLNTRYCTYFSLAWNQIPDHPMVQITGRTELGKLLELAGEAAESTYATQKAVYENPVATQEELTAAMNALETGLSEQKETKADELKTAITEAEAISGESYTETSFAALTAAIASAKAAAEAQDSTLADILLQMDALSAAREALVADVDWSALDKQIEAAKAIRKSQYTSASYQYMNTVLTEAQELRNRPDTNLPTQEEIEAMAQKLEARIAALVPAGSSGGGTEEPIEPADENEFEKLKDAVDTATQKLGSSAESNAIIAAANGAINDKEIGSDAVEMLISVLNLLEAPDSDAVTADRTGLDALLALAKKITEDNPTSGIYSSTDALTTAISTVESYLDFADNNPSADTIEMASEVLRDAFDSLERVEPETEGIDVNNLADGKYTVPIQIKNASQPTQDSMANDAVEPNAMIVVAGGETTIELTFKPKYMDIAGGMWGHLLRSWVYEGISPDAASENAYQGSNRTLMELDGYYTTDPSNPGVKIPMGSKPDTPDDNSQWPGTVRFKMPYVSTQSGYNTIYIRVSVDAMGGDSGAQNALLVIDYSGIKKLDEAGQPIEDGVVRTELKAAITESNQRAQGKENYTAASYNKLAVALTTAYSVRFDETATQEQLDAATVNLNSAASSLIESIEPIAIAGDYLTDTLNAGVFAEAPIEAVEDGIMLKASFASTSEYSAIADKLDNTSAGDFIAYSISTVKESGDKVQPSGDVTVKIKIPDGWDPSKLTVYHLNNLTTAKPQEITGGRVENGFFVFETDSFSYFALAEKLSSSGGVEDPDDGNYEAGTVEFSAGSHGSLTATVDGKTISSGDTVEGGKTVVFTADPNSGYRVDEWSGDVSGSATTKRVTVDGDVYVHVSFRESSSLEWDEELEEEEGISNGIYSVPVRVKKAATPSEDSMANNAVSQYAKARVTSSGVTYTLTFKGMSLNGLYGHLLDMWYYDPDDDDLTNPIPCDVDATYTDTDLDGDRSTFPREVSFTVDGDPLDEIYIRVNVDAMNTVGAGEQDAILRVYWDDAEKDGGDAAEEEAEELEDEAEDVEISSGSTFSASRLDTLIENGGELIVSNDDASVRFSEAALLEIDDQAGSSSIKVSIAETAASSMSEAQAEKAGNRPAYTIEVAAGSKAVTDFGANATVTLPYALQDNETANGLSVWMIDEDGALTVLDCTYNSTKETVAFSTDRAGVFVIAYSAENAWINPFTDVASNSWYFEAVRYVSVNGLFNGTSETAFSPDSAMTRAMLWTVLARYDGQDTSGGSNWYEAARNWAMKEGISDGTNPDGNITREQLAAILYRYAGEPSADGGTLDQFTDRTNISSYATEAMQWATEQGIVNGKSNSTLDPQGNATRAEVATMMMRFAEKYPNQ